MRKTGKVDRPHDGRNQDSGKHDAQAQDQRELLSLLILIDAHWDRENAKHGKAHKRNHLGHEVGELKLLARQADKGTNSVAEAHRQKCEKHR